MTEQEREDICLTARKLADEDAAKHYEELLKVITASIPDYFYQEGDPQAKRPLGFTSDADSFQFFLDLGREYATTSVIFTYSKNRKIWKLKRYISRIGRGPMGMVLSQIKSKTLANAILASRELYQEILAEAKAVEDPPPINEGSFVN